jgi:DNA-binding NarL/FixJ family response regulator
MREPDVVTVVIARFDGWMGPGLAATLREDGRVRVLASALTGEELERVIERRRPHVAILGEDVVHASLLRLRRRQPSLGIVVLAGSPTPLYCSLLRSVGATCLARGASVADIIATINFAAQGEVASSPATGERVAPRAVVDGGLLTRRELEVLEHRDAKESYAEIARALRISVNTVKTHAASARRKLTETSDAELQIAGRGA